MAAETFTTAWRRFDDVPAECVLPWLLATSRRILANLYRSEQRRRALIERLRTVSPREAEDQGDGEHELAIAALGVAIGKLGERDLEILTLTVWEELPHRDIARTIGVVESTVAVRLHRARRRLAKEYAKAQPQAGHHPLEGARRGGEAS